MLVDERDVLRPGLPADAAVVPLVDVGDVRRQGRVHANVRRRRVRLLQRLLRRGL